MIIGPRCFRRTALLAALHNSLGGSWPTRAAGSPRWQRGKRPLRRLASFFGTSVILTRTCVTEVPDERGLRGPQAFTRNNRENLTRRFPSTKSSRPLPGETPFPFRKHKA